MNKKYLLLFALFIAMFGSFQMNAQNQVTANPTSGPTVCDGSAYLSDTVTVSPTSIYWSGNGAVIQQGGYYVYGLCSGTYTVTFTDTSAVSQTLTFVIGSGNTNPCSTFAVTVLASASSDSLVCNGSVYAQVSGGTSPYTYSWSMGNTTATISALCPGTYTCTVVDANGCSMNSSATVSDSTSGSGGPCAGFYSYINTYPSYDSTSCDGYADVFVSGGSAPYSFSWSSGVSGTINSNTSSVSNLCQGSYTCLVVDANGCSYAASGYVYSSGWNPGPSDSVIVIDNGSYADSVIVDTLGTQWVSDCVLDMTIIDSAYISGYYYANIDSVLVTWVLLDASGNTLSTYTTGYYTGGTSTGVVTTNLIIYCMMKAQQNKFISVSDQIYLNSAAMGISDQNLDMLSFVNPFDSEINLNFNSIALRNIQIFDLQGALIMENNCDSNSFVANTQHLKRGTYILRITEGNAVTSLRLIK